MSSGQMDCPWCGCGWLITCSKCSKAFTYAEIKETDVPLIELGRREVERRGLTSVTKKEIEDWALAMQEDLAKFSVGQIVIYLDGEYLPIDEENIQLEGWYARHDLVRLPHYEALKNPQLLNDKLGDSSYWLSRELPDRG